ncbi:MAG: hypothetical protein GX410_09170, partial [Elusimicrobia bacterium]|nr:hypothetical protein [Elusimicrobiota bacterium]
MPPLLAASTLAALLLWLPGPVYAPDSNPEAFGLHLLYGVAHPQVYWSMPLSSLCSDFVRFLLPAYGGALFFQLLSLMALAGGFALAWALSSARAAMLGLLAAGVLRHFLWSGVSADAQTALYSVA